MAAHYPDLTPEQLAYTVEAGRHFAACYGGVTYVLRVEQVFATGWCRIRYVAPHDRARTWIMNTASLRRSHHPVSAPGV